MIQLPQNQFRAFSALAVLEHEAQTKIVEAIASMPEDPSLGSLAETIVSAFPAPPEFGTDVAELLVNLYRQASIAKLTDEQVIQHLKEFIDAFLIANEIPEENDLRKIDWNNFKIFIEKVLHTKGMQETYAKYRGVGLIGQNEKVYSASAITANLTPFELLTQDDPDINAVLLYQLKIDYTRSFAGSSQSGEVGPPLKETITLYLTEWALNQLKGNILRAENYSEKIKENIQNKQLKIISSN